MELREKILTLFAEPQFCSENYKGEVDENGLPHGEGTMKYAPKSTVYWLGYSDYAVAPKLYQGQWCHGVRCGEGKMTFYTSDCQHYSYTGQWAAGLPEGSGTIRIINERGKESITPYHFVAGLREGRNTVVEFGKTIECEWKAGVKEGAGICTMPNGQQFRGVWHSDNLEIEKCDFMESTESPTLIVTLYFQGFDYRRRVVALVVGSCGEHTIGDSLPILCDKGFKDSEPLIEILGVENGVVEYIVDGIYSDNRAMQVGRVAPGETVKHAYRKKATATIYDEDHDYEIVREIEIRYNK